MIGSKEELLACANAWVSRAKSDISAQINGFMQMTRMNMAQVAEALDIPQRELAGIINGTCEISLMSFAKMLIASDNVLEIKPLSSMPMGMMPHHGEPQNQSRGMHHRPMPPRPMRGGYPMPPMGDNGGSTMPPMTPPMPPRFGGMPGIPFPHAVNEPMPTETNRVTNLGSESRANLVGIIRDNGWDGEIDLATASHGELVDLIETKRADAPRNVAEANHRNRFEDMGVTCVNDSLEETTSADAFRQMLDDAIAENPNLRDVIDQYTR